MKNFVFILLSVCLICLILQGCGNDTTPKKEFESYIKSWEKKDFKGMYAILDKETKKKINEAEFSERYNKIYSGIEVNKVNIQPNFEDGFSKDDGYTIIPFKGSVSTIAGNLRFNNKAKFMLEKVAKDKEVWRMKWDSTMIFPDLGEGEKIRITTFPAYRGAIYDRNEKPLAISDQQGKREYPNGINSGHLTGYIKQMTKEMLDKMADKGYDANDLVGISGAERAFEDQLRPKKGAEIFVADSRGIKKKVLIKKEAKDGDNVKLNIDSNIQTALYEQLKDEAGVGVAMNPKTGEILGLVSTPSYDPKGFIDGMSGEVWNSLNNNPKKPFTNRFAGAFAPGSTFKTLTAAIGLSANKLNPDRDRNISGLTWQKPKWGKQYVKRAHTYSGPSNLWNAMIHSDNIYFAQVALDIGTNDLTVGAKKFGIGDKMPFEFTVQTSQLFNKGITSEAQLADTGYGQAEVLINPVNLCVMYSFACNEGNIIRPKLLYQENAQAEIWKQNVCTKEQADLLRKCLRGVVTSGTGKGALLPNIEIAGKTGTAELKLTREDQGAELGWFSAFDMNSKLSVVMMIEGVEDKGGSAYVVPKVKSIYEQFCK